LGGKGSGGGRGSLAGRGSQRPERGMKAEGRVTFQSGGLRRPPKTEHSRDKKVEKSGFPGNPGSLLQTNNHPIERGGRFGRLFSGKGVIKKAIPPAPAKDLPFRFARRAGARTGRQKTTRRQIPVKTLGGPGMGRVPSRGERMGGLGRLANLQTQGGTCRLLGQREMGLVGGGGNGGGPGARRSLACSCLDGSVPLVGGGTESEFFSGREPLPLTALLEIPGSEKKTFGVRTGEGHFR